MQRRTMLKVGALGALQLSLPNYLALRAAEGPTKARAKSVILIYTGGGISHHDSFDPKPSAPAEIRGEFGTIATKVPGVRYSDLIPRLAQAADQYTLIRSAWHKERDHGVSAYYMQRGYPEPSPLADRPDNQQNTHPNIGSHVGRILGSRGGLPPYICVPGVSYLAKVNYYTAGWMGKNYNPFLLKADPNQENFQVKDFSPPVGISPARLQERVALAHVVNGGSHCDGSATAVKAMAGYYQSALDMLTSGVAQKAFDLQSEPAANRDAYGRTRLGQSCVLARRLVEAGVPFVTVDDDAWDHHGKIFPQLKERLPELDGCVSRLIEDLRERGLLDTTLVALLTDFGRTPRVNAGAGRDHWPDVFSVVFAGAGIPGGQVLGASDKIGAYPAERPISPKDIAATLYRFLGINPFQEYRTRENRPMQVLDEGQVIAEL